MKKKHDKALVTAWHKARGKAEREYKQGEKAVDAAYQKADDLEAALIKKLDQAMAKADKILNPGKRIRPYSDSWSRTR